MTLTFKYHPEDPSTDAETVLLEDGQPTKWAVQHLLISGGYSVNYYDGEGDDFFSLQLFWTRTLAQAKTHALAYFLAHAEGTPVPIAGSTKRLHPDGTVA